MQTVTTTDGARDELIPTRWSLLSRLKNSEDQESWKVFFDTYARLIYGVAQKAGLSQAEAQDVVQETVIAVARNITDFRTRPDAGSFKAWLLNITRWRIIDQQRKRQRERRVIATPEDDGSRTALVERIADPLGGSLETIWDQEWERNLTEAALQRVKGMISAKQFQIFDLYVLKQWPVREVARTLRVGIGQIYLSKHRVSLLLRKEVKKLEKEQV